MKAPTNQRSEQIRRQLAMERLLQDCAALPTTQATEENDVGRDLAHFPHGWWIAWLLVLFVIGAIAGVIVVAQMLGPR